VNQMQIDFISTRSRLRDPESSRIAAKNAASGKAADLRKRIQNGLQARKAFGQGALTAREIAEKLNADYYDVQRRLSECANIRKTGEMRDGAMVWEYCEC